MARPIAIAAVDDHPMLLLGLPTAAGTSPRALELVMTAPTVADLLAADLHIDVTLLDLRLGDASRPRDNVRQLMYAGHRVLIYTEGDRQAWIQDAIAAGASGVVLKAQPVSELIAAVEAVHEGELVIGPHVAEVLHTAPHLRPHLTPREIETLRLVSTGLASKQAASLMGVKEETVKEYLKRVRAKYEQLGRPAPSRIALHQRAVEDGLLDSD